MKKLAILLTLILLMTSFMLAAPVSGANILSGDFWYTESNGQATIMSLSTTTIVNLDIPAVIDGYPVVAIYSNAFSNKNEIKTVTIPSSVTFIGNYAFGSCLALTSVTIADGPSPLSIEPNLFYNCTALESVVIPDRVTDMGKYAFRGCTKLENVRLSNNLSTISECFFMDCTSLKNIVIPNSITSIEGSAFSGSGIKNITLSTALKDIGTYAFINCTALDNLILPDSLETIGLSAFQGCTGLSSIIIPKKVSTLSYGLFALCTNLTTIEVGVGVTAFEDNLFSYCSSLSTIIFNGNAPTYPTTLLGWELQLTIYIYEEYKNSFYTGYSYSFANRSVKIINPFSLKSGYVKYGRTIELSPEPFNSCTFYYTTNGSAPSAQNGTLYTTPIVITGDTVIKVAAYSSSTTPHIFQAEYDIFRDMGSSHLSYSFDFASIEMMAGDPEDEYYEEYYAMISEMLGDNIGIMDLTINNRGSWTYNNATVLVAAYDGNKLLSTKIITTDLVSGDNEALLMNYEAEEFSDIFFLVPANMTSMKAFVWSGTDGLLPLADIGTYPPIK